MIIERSCTWCGIKYKSERQKAISLCGSAACYKGLSRFQSKHLIETDALSDLLADRIINKCHPNKKYIYGE